jgi:aminopeptidase N
VLKWFRATQVGTENSFSLPVATMPTRYDLWLKTDVDKEIFEFSGRVRIYVKVLQPTKEVTIHQRQTKVTNVILIDPNDVAKSTKLKFSVNEEKEFLNIWLPNKVAKDQKLILELYFGGVLRDDFIGFHRLSYTDSGNQTVWIAATSFEPTNARHAFPCYDEPAIRAVINLEIQHDEAYHSISNMPVISRNRINGTSYVITKFQDTPPMQSYMLSFVVSNLKHIEINDAKVPQRIFARQSAIDNGELDYIAEHLVNILKTFEDYFGIPFPLPKLDHVLLPTYSSPAIEHWGMIVYRERNLLMSKEISPRERDAKFMIVFHEMTVSSMQNVFDYFFYRA